MDLLSRIFDAGGGVKLGLEGSQLTCCQRRYHPHRQFALKRDGVRAPTRRTPALQYPLHHTPLLPIDRIASFPPTQPILRVAVRDPARQETSQAGPAGRSRRGGAERDSASRGTRQRARGGRCDGSGDETARRGQATGRGGRLGGGVARPRGNDVLYGPERKQDKMLRRIPNPAGGRCSRASRATGSSCADGLPGPKQPAARRRCAGCARRTR